ncbi:hypothetical protein GCM10009753_45270 [Streptantibioticus ferralitis]
MLLRLAYLGVTNAFAILRLLPMSGGDFFEAVTLSGARLYAFAVIEHTNRRIRILGATAHPAASWVAQATENLVMDLEDAGCRARYMIRDRDGKYPALFDAILADAEGAVHLTAHPVEPMAGQTPLICMDGLLGTHSVACAVRTLPGGVSVAVQVLLKPGAEPLRGLPVRT